MLDTFHEVVLVALFGRGCTRRDRCWLSCTVLCWSEEWLAGIGCAAKVMRLTATADVMAAHDRGKCSIM
jgi:hypothetical protein